MPSVRGNEGASAARQGVKRWLVGAWSLALIAAGSCDKPDDAPLAQETDASVAVSSQALSGLCSSQSFGGHDYLFCVDLKTWDLARSECTGSGMDLVHIDSATENTFVRTGIGFLAQSWIGASDTAQEGAWKWSNDGTQFWQGTWAGGPVGGRYSNWSVLQPDDLLLQDCATMRGIDGDWTDEGCGLLLGYVCESLDPAPPPPSSSTADTDCWSSPGLQANGAWPMRGLCPLRRSAGKFIGSQANTVNWVYLTGGDIRTGVAVGADGTIYFGSDDTYVYALLQNGGLRWRYKTAGSVRSSPLLTSGGALVVGSDDNYLYSLDAATGALRWRYNIGDDVRSSPAVAPDGTIYVGADSNRLYAFNPNGTLLWSYLAGGDIDSSPALLPDGTIVFGSDDDFLYALKPDAGLSDAQRLLWKSSLGADINAIPAIGPGDHFIYARTQGGKLKKVDPADGHVVSTFSGPNDLDTDSSPAVGLDGNVYVGLGHNVYGLGPNLTQKWVFTTLNDIKSSPSIGADGTVYVGADDQRVYALRPADGSLLWSLTASGLGNAFRGTAAIGKSGAIYIGNDDNKLYSIGSFACDSTHKCGNGMGPCTGDSGCANGLSCGYGIAERYGLPADFGVCWDPGDCATFSPPECGSLRTLCGDCCVPNCGAAAGTPDGCGHVCQACVAGKDTDKDGLLDCDERTDNDQWTDPLVFNGVDAQRGNSCHASPTCSAIDTTTEVDACFVPVESNLLHSGWSFNTTSRNVCDAGFGFDFPWKTCGTNFGVRYRGVIRLAQTGKHCFSVTGLTDKQCAALTVNDDTITLTSATGPTCYDLVAGVYPIEWFYETTSTGTSDLHVRHCFGGASTCTPTTVIPSRDTRREQDADQRICSSAACSEVCPCGPGGAATSATQCQSGLVLRNDVATLFGLPAGTSVCWDPSCDDRQSAGFECGTTTSRCGLCPSCTPNCAGKQCGSDGCWGTCGDDCTAGEAGCESNLDCAQGLVCGRDNGARFGADASLRVCWLPECENLDQTAIPCGSVSDPCGVCPACVPDCDGHSCGDDGCGGSCGSCAAGEHCNGSLGLCEGTPLAPRFQLPPDMSVSTAPAGTLPGSFSVSHQGSAEYEIPLEVPPGRGGIQPELSLKYNGARGNGYLGVGWGLEGLSSVARCNKTVAQDGFTQAPRFAPDDAFCLDGARLVVVDSQIDLFNLKAVVRYRTEDDRFTLVEANYQLQVLNNETIRALGPTSFVAKSKDGRIFTYGEGIPGYSRPGPNGLPMDPDEHLWTLTRVEDRSGNQMEINYSLRFRETEAGLVRDYYPLSMTYSSGVTIVFYYTFDDEYAETRVDDPSVYRNGIQVRQDALLRRVSVRVDGRWVRHYELSYTAPSGDEPHTRLSSVRDCTGGDTPATSVCKPSTTFAYSATMPGVEATQEIGDMASLHYSQLTAPVVLDLNGDGLDDLLFAVGKIDDNLFVPDDQTWTWSAALSVPQPDGTVTYRTEATGLTIGGIKYSGFFFFSDADISAVGSGNGAVFDWDNDGRQDLLEYDWAAKGQPREYTVVLYDGQFFTRYRTEIPQAQSQGHDYWTQGQTYVLDVNGDRFKDLLVCDWTTSGPRWRVYMHQGGAVGGGVFSGNAAGFLEAQRRDLQLDAPCLNGGIIIDKDGDGAEEVLQPTGTYGKDPGYFITFNPDGTPAIEATNAIAGDSTGHLTPLKWPYSGVRLLDLNGDGLRDIVRYDLEGTGDETQIPHVLIEVNRGDGKFDIHEQILDLRNQPSFHSWIMASSFPYDANLDGKDDLVMPLLVSETSAGMTPWLSTGYGFGNIGSLIGPFGAGTRPIDVNGDGVPGLLVGSKYAERAPVARERLTAVVDGLGATTVIDYGRLTNDFVYTSDLFDDDLHATCRAPFLCLRPRGFAVSDVFEFDQSLAVFPPLPARQYKYRYQGARAGAGGRGSLGFSQREIEKRDLYAPGGGLKANEIDFYDNRTYSPDDAAFPFAFKPKRVLKSSFVDGIQYSVDTRTEYELTHPTAVSYAGLPRLRTTTRFSYDLQNQIYDEVGTETNEVLERDLFGNVTRSKATFNARETELIERSFKHLETQSFQDNWLISLPTRTVDTYNVAQLDGSNSGRTRVTQRDYYGSGLLHFDTRDPDDVNFRLETEYVRGSNGNVTKVIKRGSDQVRETSIDFDDLGLYPKQVTNALGQHTQVEYDRVTGALTAMEDANGLLTQWRTDGFGRPALELDPTGLLTTTTYSAGGVARPLVVDVTTNAGAHIRDELDVRARLSRHHEWGAFGKELVQARGYDFDGNVASISRLTDATRDPDPGTTFTYDNRGQVRLLTTAGGENVRQCYNAHASCTTSPRGYTSCRIYDDRGRVSRVIDPVPESCEVALANAPARSGIEYTYDPFDRPSEITDQAGHVTRMVSDPWNRPIVLQDPDSGFHGTGYNAFGEPTSHLDGNLQETDLEYDLLGRLKLRTDKNAQGPGDDAVSEWIWDGGGTPDPNQGELFGRLTETRSPDGVNRRFKYDPVAGDLTSTVDEIDGESFETTLLRDEFGRVRQVRYPQAPSLPQVAVEHVYDDFDHLVALRDAFGSPTAPGYWALTSVDDHGSNSVETYGNGLVQTFTYDANGRLDVTATLALPLFAVDELDVDYDSDGNVGARKDLLRSQTETYYYDGQQRMFYDSFANDGARTFDYDNIGNIHANPDVRYDLPQPHALAFDGTFTYGYDGVGNRIRKEGAGQIERLSYTPFGKPRAIWNEDGSGNRSNEVSFSYDSQSNRARKDGPDAVTTYVGGGYERRQPKAGGAAEHVYYISNGARVVSEIKLKSGEPLKVYYLHADNLGSPRLITSDDGFEQAVDFDSWGTPRNPDWTSSSPPTLAAGVTTTFTGHEADGEHGLINMRGRIYDPRTFQFLTPDPFTQHPFSSTGLNRYAYAMQNPLTLVDPSGYDGSCGANCTEYDQFPDEIVTGSAPSNPISADTGSPSGGPTGGLDLADLGGDWYDRGNDLGIPHDTHTDAPLQTAGDAGPSRPVTIWQVAVLTEKPELVDPGRLTAGAEPTFAEAAIEGLNPYYTIKRWFDPFASPERKMFETTLLALGPLIGILGSEAAVVAEPAIETGSSVLPRFTQTTASVLFRNGPFAGKSIGEVSAALRSGAVSPSQLPVDIIVRNGQALALNTRSALALMRGGVDPAKWTIVNRTGEAFFENLLTERLAANGLTEAGTEVLRITGMGKNASAIW